MDYIKNNSELSTLFKNEELQLFFQRFLRELEEPYTLKEFLKDGWEKTYEKQFQQLRKSFTVVEKNPKKDGHLDGGFLEVERCIDSVRFRVGDVVRDLDVYPDGKIHTYPISRLYEDDRGLHVRFDMGEGSVSWSDLSRIEHI
jgi:hypothetical protein